MSAKNGDDSSFFKVCLPDKEKRYRDAGLNRKIFVSVRDLVVNVVALHIASEKKAKESTACFKAVIHHFLRIYQKLPVHIVHRIGLDLDIDENSDHDQDTDKREDIIGLVVVADHLADFSDDQDHHNALRETDDDVLRRVDAEEVSGKTGQQNTYDA